MYIFIKKDRESKKVLTVETVGVYKNKTEQDMLEAIEKFNDTHQSTVYEAVNIENETLYEAFRFLMGEDKYRRTYMIEDIVDAMDSLKGQFDDIEYAIRGLDSDLLKVRTEIKELKEE